MNPVRSHGHESNIMNPVRDDKRYTHVTKVNITKMKCSVIYQLLNNVRPRRTISNGMNTQSIFIHMLTKGNGTILSVPYF